MMAPQLLRQPTSSSTISASTSSSLENRVISGTANELPISFSAGGSATKGSAVGSSVSQGTSRGRSASSSVSTVSATVAAVNAATNRRNEMAGIIADILRSNTNCVECNKKDPDWLSLNLGCLMCIDCSGWIKISKHLVLTFVVPLSLIVAVDIIVFRNSSIHPPQYPQYQITNK